MLNFYVKIAVIIILLNKPLQTVAQLSFPWHEAGLISGMSGYIGDLNPDKYLKFNNMLIGLTYKYNFNHRNSVRVNLVHTKIQADDKQSKNEWQKRRNLNFFSPLTEIIVAYELNFFEYSPTMYQGLFITPYINLGIGAFRFDPQTYLNGQIYHLRNYSTEGQDQKGGNEKTMKKYSLYNVSIPVSLGLKFNLSKQINIFSELSYKFTLTDYLDDVSTNYAYIPTDSDQGKIGASLADRSPELGYNSNIIGSQRGDSSKKDMYMFVIIGITINFGIPECIGPL
ncbi:MAG: DUF6089 family protein [Solitalea-like symbiont of Acarus siro]